MKFIVKEKDYEYEYLLSPGVFIVGRDETCDLTIASKAISRRHMSCTVEGESVTVRDLGSRNGIRVNGEKVARARLADGDRVSLGSAALVLKAPPAAAAGATEGEYDHGAGQSVSLHPQMEDEESTPPEGSLVKLDTSEGQAGLYERGGRWYVRDPATGREVEIVPAQERKKRDAGGGEGSGSLLAGRKGRMILGGAAIAVVLLFALSLLLTGPETAPPERPPEGEFDDMVARTLVALGGGDVESAERMALFIRDRRPESGAAESLLQLVRLWALLEEDFRQYSFDVVRQLHDLEYHHASDEVRRFVRRHAERIDESDRQYEQVEAAGRAAGRGELEEAYRIMAAIDENRPARRDSAGLWQDIKTRLRRDLENQLQAARTRNRWDEARDISDKLMEYFPETRSDLESERDAFAERAHHGEMIETAREAVGQGHYDRAAAELAAVPETSFYYNEARNLAETIAELRLTGDAESHFTAGRVDEALGMLEGLSVREAVELKDRITAAREVYEAARRSEEKRDYIKASEHWRRLAGLEGQYEGKSRYLAEAERALEELPANRLRYVEELIELARGELDKENYITAREMFDRAVGIESDLEDTPSELLQLREMLHEEAESIYQQAINVTDDPERQIAMLETVMQLLAPDEYYYRRARERIRNLRN